MTMDRHWIERHMGALLFLGKISLWQCIATKYVATYMHVGMYRKAYLFLSHS